ncbi:MAG: ATP-binding protein [Planctomycetota bacterium]
MNRQRKLYLVVLAAAAASLAVYVCFYTSWESAAPTAWVLLCLAFIGILLLGWYGLKFHNCITNTIEKLKDNRAVSGQLHTPTTAGMLDEAIDTWSKHCAGRIHALENETKELRLKVQLCQNRKSWFESVINSLCDAVFVTDDSDCVLAANRAAGRLFGFDAEKIEHRNISVLVGREELTALIRQARQRGLVNARGEIELSSAGRQRTFDCTASCIFDESGQFWAVVSSLHDITREKEISRLKNEFVNHVSHELKTPLASITACAEMLADGEVQDEQGCREFYDVIQKQSKRLCHLIDDILNLSRIESGLIKVNKEPVSILMMIKEAVNIVQSRAQEKGIQIVEHLPAVFGSVYADKDMLVQVIVNLLGNAVKYTPQGGTISVESEVNEADGIVNVAVCDTGVGIPEDEIKHIFDKFYRVEANKSCAEGTGLGLSLVRQIVEKVHHGRVFADSRAGQGSRIGFELALHSGQEAAISC